MSKKASTAVTPEAGADIAPPMPPLPETYEGALAELEQLVARMEAGALPLDQLLVSYQRGAQLLAHCRARLEAVEAQVKRLEDGQLKPWDVA
ncbi:MAG: exodeoxyribonuclease VII small subunit [Proteobacteria bacterium]|uniref:exodeoxyribonuclease VII small subunit n=1 Tax=Aquabacterium sp. TaxID=1872578 RepID=UPI0035C75286|nr:exodeoxyribonuclease VII small subunit [Pseudomonadota bacterium]